MLQRKNLKLLLKWHSNRLSSLQNTSPPLPGFKLHFRFLHHLLQILTWIRRQAQYWLLARKTLSTLSPLQFRPTGSLPLIQLLNQEWLCGRSEEGGGKSSPDDSVEVDTGPDEE
jgi:hypothetical protein